MNSARRMFGSDILIRSVAHLAKLPEMSSHASQKWDSRWSETCIFAKTVLLVILSEPDRMVPSFHLQVEGGCRGGSVRDWHAFTARCATEQAPLLPLS